MATFEIVKIDKTLTDQTIEFFKENFLRYENICIATNILGSEEALTEMLIWLEELLKDEISFVARDIVTKQLFGICINKIKSCPSTKNVENLFAQFQSSALQFIEDYHKCMESTFNVFKEWHINCEFEICFLSTRADQCGRGVATALTKYSIDFAKNLSRGDSPVSKDLPIHIQGLRPQAVCSIFSSCYAQKLGETLGFQTLCKVPHEDFMVGGKSLAYYIEPKHEYSTLAAIRL